jgi:ABC-2 type transport system ATP-binding protein
VLILDEPTAGVDVELRQDIWNLLKRVNNQGTTVLLTTHYMEEAEYLCKELAILHKGQIIDQGHISSLSLSDQSRNLVLHLQSDIKEAPQQDLIEVEQKDVRTLSLVVHPEADLSSYLHQLESIGVGVGYVSSPTSRLEQYFRSQTGAGE